MTNMIWQIHDGPDSTFGAIQLPSLIVVVIAKVYLAICRQIEKDLRIEFSNKFAARSLYLFLFSSYLPRFFFTRRSSCRCKKIWIRNVVNRERARANARESSLLRARDEMAAGDQEDKYYKTAFCRPRVAGAFFPTVRSPRGLVARPHRTAKTYRKMTTVRDSFNEGSI